MGNKQKLAFIDHPFHKKTKSTQFVKEILSKEYIVIELWNEIWEDGKIISIDYLNKNNFDIICFFQHLLPCKYLKKLKCKNIVWFPMWDREVNRTYFDWIKLLPLNIKIVSFSKTLFDKVKKLGFYKSKIIKLRTKTSKR